MGKREDEIYGMIVVYLQIFVVLMVIAACLALPAPIPQSGFGGFGGFGGNGGFGRPRQNYPLSNGGFGNNAPLGGNRAFGGFGG